MLELTEQDKGRLGRFRQLLGWQLSFCFVALDSITIIDRSILPCIWRGRSGRRIVVLVMVVILVVVLMLIIWIGLGRSTM